MKKKDWKNKEELSDIKEKIHSILGKAILEEYITYLESKIINKKTRKIKSHNLIHLFTN